MDVGPSEASKVDMSVASTIASLTMKDQSVPFCSKFYQIGKKFVAGKSTSRLFRFRFHDHKIQFLRSQTKRSPARNDAPPVYRKRNFAIESFSKLDVKLKYHASLRRLEIPHRRPDHNCANDPSR